MRKTWSSSSSSGQASSSSSQGSSPRAPPPLTASPRLLVRKSRRPPGHPSSQSRSGRKKDKVEDKGDDGVACVICLADQTTDTGVLGCGHSFCALCIRAWASAANVCPLCKAAFNVISICDANGREQEQVHVADVALRLEDVPPPDELELVFCLRCGSSDDEHILLLCDACDAACHTRCCEPPLPFIPHGAWYCEICVAGAQATRGPGQRRQQQRRRALRDSFASLGAEEVAADVTEDELIIRHDDDHLYELDDCGEDISSPVRFRPSAGLDSYVADDDDRAFVVVSEDDESDFESASPPRGRAQRMAQAARGALAAQQAAASAMPAVGTKRRRIVDESDESSDDDDDDGKELRLTAARPTKRARVLISISSDDDDGAGSSSLSTVPDTQSPEMAAPRGAAGERVLETPTNLLSGRSRRSLSRSPGQAQRKVVSETPLRESPPSRRARRHVPPRPQLQPELREEVREDILRYHQTPPRQASEDEIRNRILGGGATGGRGRTLLSRNLQGLLRHVQVHSRHFVNSQPAVPTAVSSGTTQTLQIVRRMIDIMSSSSSSDDDADAGTAKSEKVTAAVADETRTKGRSIDKGKDKGKGKGKGKGKSKGKGKRKAKGKGKGKGKSRSKHARHALARPMPPGSWRHQAKASMEASVCEGSQYVSASIESHE
ncbi:ring PHD family protein [Thecamonas trahens ATCC 50062]|uniref:Ring PHD family protein n=1 Tax=Thecamonas trahens ATCC 50062 TaxID=461836 RepID=A0A0L0DNK5_THETB|nr:ring PHD family protein [Thecamonas trahens ATCC 50062]KNC53003.1 ring PHD family protein [Thecamonas trahens ATCC 50062]|eukprot:XP_013754890.1 ring PHD family protein [Thecamonas trahens ATCC 50062]